MKNNENKSKRLDQRTETLMRVPVLIVSGIIIVVWRALIVLFALINFCYSIFSKKRLRELAELSEIWNTQMYIFSKYMTFMSNARPFPFMKLTPNISEYQ